MTFKEKLLSFFYGKWLPVVIGVGATLALPTLYNQWATVGGTWALSVLGCGIGAIILCVYKFMDIRSKEQQSNVSTKTFENDY